MSAKLLAVICAVGLFSWWTIFTLVLPRHLLSFFRYKLWRLRDRLARERLAGSLPDCDAVRMDIRIIESIIQRANSVTVLGFCLSQVVQRLYPISKELGGEIDLIYRREPKEVQEKLRGYMDELDMLCLKHAVFCTPSGWLSLPFLACTAATKLAIKKGVRNLRRIFGRSFSAVELVHFSQRAWQVLVATLLLNMKDPVRRFTKSQELDSWKESAPSASASNTALAAAH